MLTNLNYTLRNSEDTESQKLKKKKNIKHESQLKGLFPNHHCTPGSHAKMICIDLKALWCKKTHRKKQKEHLKGKAKMIMC